MVRRGQAGSGGGTGAVPVGFGFVLVTILYFFSSMTWNTSAPRPPDNPPSVTPVTPAYDTTTASTTPSHQIPAPDRTPSFPVESVSTAPIETEPEVVGIDDKLNSGIPSSRPYQLKLSPFPPGPPAEPKQIMVSEWALSKEAADRLPFLPIEVPDHAKYAAMPREGKGVMCIANHVKPGDKAASQYLSQCAYALQRWHEAFQAAGGKYLKYKLALVTDRDRFEHQVKIDRDFKEFTEIALTHPIFVDDWDGTPQVKFGKMKMPQSSKFQGFPQLWVHKFEAFARSPFETTMFIDYDTHACLGAEKLFDDYEAYDLAPMACKFMCWGGTRQTRDWGYYIKYLPTNLLEKYKEINEPLTAGIMMNTANPKVTYLNLVARDVYIGAMREVGNPMKHDQPSLREAVFLVGHTVNHTRIDEYEGCDFKVAKRCENKCRFVHGKMTVDPVTAGGKTMTSWASRIGQK